MKNTSQEGNYIPLHYILHYIQVEDNCQQIQVFIVVSVLQHSAAYSIQYLQII